MPLALMALLALNAGLHAAVLWHHGLKNNAPPALFGALYLALAIAVWLSWPYALWAVLAVVLIGTVGLMANYRKLDHTPTYERAILAVNPLIFLVAAYVLSEPRRVCRRLQLLSRMEHHEQDNEQVFP